MRAQPFRKLLSVKVTLFVAALVSLLMCASPLLGIHGAESALVLGLVLPPFVAAASARIVHASRLDPIFDAPLVLSDALSVAFVAFAIPTLVLALDAFRIKQCAPLEGLVFMLLGPGIGVMLAAVTGVLCGALVKSARPATTLAVLAPIAFIALGLYRFWASPAIFAYSQFVGFFPGTIYDEGVSIPGAYITFRIVSAAMFGGLCALHFAIFDVSNVRLDPKLATRAPVRATLAVILLALVVAADVYGPELGHRGSAAFIAETLGGHMRGERCDVYVPRELEHRELVRLTEDCDFRVTRAERDLGVTHPARITAFFFRDSEEKQRLMGAARTYIAKPWRDEVYLQVRAWPHPVLAHEIAHVVAGATAMGPFRTGGSLAGLLPNPGLIEGVAVAVAWEPRDDLTPHEYARAMKEIGLLPPLERVFGLRFMLEPSANVYTVSGSFIRWLMDTEGSQVVRRAYLTGDIEASTGKSLAALERDWLAFIDEVPLPEEALELAKARFSGRSVFSAVCPHVVARLEAALGQDLAAGDDVAALETCSEILDIDETEVATRALRAAVYARTGHMREAEADVAALEGEPRAPDPILASAKEGIADAAWRRGDREVARRIYEELLSTPKSADLARQLEVKLLGLEAGGETAQLVRALLVGESAVADKREVAMHLVRDLREVRRDGLAFYLEARMLHAARDFDRSLPLFEEALARSLPSDRLTREAERQLGEALFATGALLRAQAHYTRLSRDGTLSESQRALARDFLRRIRFVSRR